MITHIENKEQYLELTKDKKVLVDFYADWCGPCRMLSPVIEEADEENVLGMDVLKINVDDLPELAAKFGVQSIPTLLILKDGKVEKGALGYMQKAQLIDFVK